MDDKKKPNITSGRTNLFRVIFISENVYEIFTTKSPNRYVPYESGRYKCKTYIYMEGEETDDYKSEYEEIDLNDIYVSGSPKYKMFIEVVLEPLNRDTFNLSSGNTSTNKLTDNEWNQWKQDFIEQYLTHIGSAVPLYMSYKLIICICIPKLIFYMLLWMKNLLLHQYKIDFLVVVINNRNRNIDIYDEMPKRKEKELFGTKHTKNITFNRVATQTYNLLHKWLDRHRDMCEQWNNKEDILNKLNEQWNKDNDGGDIPNDNKKLNTDVSIQIDMDDPKGKKELSNMDTNVDTPTMDNILDDLETCNEPFYDIYEDDIYYDVNDENPFVDNIPMDHNKVDVPKKVHVEMKILNNTFNGSLEQEFPISDVWNI
ncbi:erythrocyte membrane protein 1 [Plasmodium falciparum RAJ116]|uniref:Erythrocyte membrane protein 1 n=1 Tax=Plasmodium falciparum RAJ116 TaxID=580058 RepID=A0A0L0CW88_PLAFA|nr:erythrocyte membrane protein 1 [Plasmodium falciparum RAJ116]